LDNIY